MSLISKTLVVRVRELENDLENLSVFKLRRKVLLLVGNLRNRGLDFHDRPSASRGALHFELALPLSKIGYYSGSCKISLIDLILSLVVFIICNGNMEHMAFRNSALAHQLLQPNFRQ